MTRRPFPRPSSSPGTWRTGCATAKTRINRPRSTASAKVAPAWRPRGSSRARSCPTTITATPTPPSSWSPSSRSPAVAIVKHANPCGAAIGRKPARGLGQGARLRSGQRLRRHRRAQPAARRGDRRGDRPAIRRGGDRPGGGGSRGVDPRAADGVAAARHRRTCPTPLPQVELFARWRAASSSRSATGSPCGRRRCAPSPAERRARPKSPICCSPTWSPSTSNPMRSSSPADGATVGIGAGQMSRVDSVRIAAAKAAEIGQVGRTAAVADSRLGARLGRLLPVRRRARSGDRGRGHRGHPARRVGARQRSHRRRRRRRDRDGVHRSPPFPTLGVIRRARY